MMKTEVPEEILHSAKSFIERFGESFKYIGRYEKQDVYKFQFPGYVLTGYPFLYLLNPETRIVTTMTGPGVFRIMDAAEKAEEKES